MTEKMVDSQVDATKEMPHTPSSSEGVTTKPKRKRRWGDRKDGRRVRTMPPMNYLIPFFMKIRSDSQNKFEDTIEITALENFLKRKHAEGYTEMGILHCVIASYVRAIAQRPGINRFVAGQRVYARNDIQGIMTVKRSMSLQGEETEVKVYYDPADGVEEVYRKFNDAVKSVMAEESNFDNVAKTVSKIPGILCRFAIGFLRFLDYFGLLPKKLLHVSPFHGSFIVTSMGSLGINAIYHHLYDFGNVPVFLSYGKKYTVMELDEDGNPVKRKYITFKAVTDERICDGYYYASAFKIIKRQLLHPEMLEGQYENVVEDID
ncbi:MAG: hypothetical protein J6R42_01650 [Clostridia bacterium]|nr:hypothetical protein [Clostridia bacterium]